LKNLHPLLNELKFKAIRSNGPGGQHVNKVSSKIELTFNVLNSNILTEEHKQLLSKKLASRLTKDSVLILFCDETRSQHKNKEIAVERFLQLIKKSLTIPKKRKPTKPTKSSVKKRLEGKKRVSIKKTSRKRPDLDL